MSLAYFLLHTVDLDSQLPKDGLGKLDRLISCKRTFKEMSQN